ncbi:MAG: hypothetical protein ACPLRH_02210, partial [Desulfotomaculales bacterium]
TVPQLKSEVKLYLSVTSAGEKEKIIRRVFREEGRAGLRAMARLLREVGSVKTNSYKLYKAGRIGEYKRERRGRKVKRALAKEVRAVTETFRFKGGSGGKKGKQGGIKNVRAQRAFQSL